MTSLCISPLPVILGLRDYTLPLAGIEPGSRPIAQSLGRWGGKVVALVLLKNFL